MAKPQLEDGHTQIANEILEQLVKIHLSSNQWQVLLCIIRKTYGFHKKVDYIANSQLVEATGLCKAVISRTLYKLTDLRLINRRGKQIGFQKDWELWRKLAEQSTLTTKRSLESHGGESSRASQSHKLAAWQAKVFHRDGLTCRICHRDIATLNADKIDLNAHHIKEWEKYPDLRFEVDNGLTLCGECHWCYHYAGNDNTYEFIGDISELRKLAEQLTFEELAIWHAKVSNLTISLAEQSTKVSSCAVAQKKKETLTKETKQKKGTTKKNSYGEFKNVRLTDDEYNKLIKRFNKRTEELIESLSIGIESKGYKYQSHYATILSWNRMDDKKQVKQIDIASKYGDAGVYKNIGELNE